MRLVAALPLLLSLTSCVVLVPFVEPHQESETHSNWSATPTVYSRAAKSTSVGSRSYRFYLSQLNDSRATKRTAAASYLGMMGPNAAGAVPALIERLSDSSKNVRRAAAKALGRIGSEPESAVPALERAAKDQDPFVARTAELALKEFRTRR